MTHIRRHARLLVLLCAALAAAGFSVLLTRQMAGASEPTPLLPKLVADQADGFTIETYSVSGVGTRDLLRFNGYIENEGKGPVDFRGSRQAPKVSPTTEKQQKYDEEHFVEDLSPSEQAEETTPPMNSFQRLFTSNSNEEENPKEDKRPFKEEPSEGELIYSSADGHDHWHLNKIARYTLVSGSTEVAPAQKVGFCLDDSQHRDESVGPKKPVYTDANGREFCDRFHPNATSLFEGISRGWRDRYERELYFQWVDVSNVLPGEYQLREEVNPLGFVKEESGEKPPSYTQVNIPGYDALPKSVSVASGQPDVVTLSSSSFAFTEESKEGGNRTTKGLAPVAYKIVSGPSHGTLSSISGGKLTYTPSAGYSGPDSFTFSAQQSGSAYPEHPQVSKVSIEVGETAESPPPSTEALLTGDPTPNYSVADQTAAGREEAFQFTAGTSGKVEELRFRTNGTANTGVTGVDARGVRRKRRQTGQRARQRDRAGHTGDELLDQSDRPLGAGRRRAPNTGSSRYRSDRASCTTTSPRRTTSARATTRASRKI